MSQTVVNQLEAVEINKEHRENPSRAGAMFVQYILKVFMEGQPVGQSGEWVAGLGLIHIGYGSHHAQRAAVRGSLYISAAQHPVIGTVLVTQAMLAGQVARGRLVAASGQELPQLGDIVVVYSVQPLLRRDGDLVFAIAQHRLPTSGVKHFSASQVPIPHSVVGAPHGQRQAFLAVLQVLFGLLPA